MVMDEHLSCLFEDLEKVGRDCMSELLYDIGMLTRQLTRFEDNGEIRAKVKVLIALDKFEIEDIYDEIRERRTFQKELDRLSG